jgi:hypothetical protein
METHGGQEKSEVKENHMGQKVDINEAARISGMSVSWWRQKVFRKEVPFYRVGRRIVLDTGDIVKIFDRCRVEPIPEERQ